MAFGAGTIVAIAGVIAYAYSQCWHFVLWHHRKPVAIIGVPALLMVGFIGYDLGSPLFTNKTVNEEFPFAFTTTAPADMGRQQVEDVMAGIAMVDQTIQEVMPKSMAAPEVTGAPLVPELSSSQQPLTVASPATNETTVATANTTYHRYSSTRCYRDACASSKPDIGNDSSTRSCTTRIRDCETQSRKLP